MLLTSSMEPVFVVARHVSCIALIEKEVRIFLGGADEAVVVDQPFDEVLAMYNEEMETKGK